MLLYIEEFDNCFVTEALFLEMIILNLFLSQSKQTIKFVRECELYLDLFPKQDSLITLASSVVAITNKQ